MSSEVSIEEIERDITSLYGKIQRCNKTKEDLLAAIQQEHNTVVELNFYIREERRRKEGERRHYDIVSLEHNINRCAQNIKVFNDTIAREDASIDNFNYMISVLKEDLARPKELVFDAATGQIISDNTEGHI